MPRSLRVHAFAKINLELRVLGIRPDGYHELRTTFQSIALADTLTFTKTRGPFRIECDDPAFPSDSTNLIWKAAERVLAIARRREQPSGVTVRVEKNIPMQAGLGGGSSNGAAALGALCKLWKVKATREELHYAAVKLGADVPYFLEGGTAIGFRRGDLIAPLDDLDPAWVVVVVPDFGVSTKDAFAWWDGDRRDRQDKNISNDLQPLVAEHYPIVSK